MSEIIVTNIQRFSLHDGPGIRTTIFLKGCSIHCPWCANPENIDCRIEQYVRAGIIGTYGKAYSIEELFSIIKRDMSFFGGNLHKDEWCIRTNDALVYLPGGVTFSGGEPLLFMNQLQELFDLFETEEIHTCIETSLYGPLDNLKLAINRVDLFYIDFKIMDKTKAAQIMEADVSCFERNLDYFSRMSDKPVIARVPIIGGYTDDIKNARSILRLIENSRQKGLNLIQIELLKEHCLGDSKYRSLNLKTPDYQGVTDEKLKAIYDVFSGCEIEIKVREV